MGCGSVADFGHAPAIRSQGHLELSAVYDPLPGRAEAFALKHGARSWFQDEAEFFAQGLDAVVVASPATAHFANVLEAAERKLPVLCEKPISMDDDEAESMISAMAGAGKPLLIGYVYRFSHIARQVKLWLEEGVIGRVRSIRLIYIWNLHGRYMPDPGGKWMESPTWRGRMLEGGPMVDCGVHMIDLCRWWLQEEVARWGVQAAWVADYESPDHVYLHLDFPSGVHAMIEMSFTYGHTAKDPTPIFSYDLIGDGGVIRYNRDGWKLEARNGQGTLIGAGASEKNFDGMYHDFERVLRTGEIGHFPTGRDGLIATRIARDATDLAVKERLAAVVTKA
jgi:predicted dehydrogenase